MALTPVVLIHGSETALSDRALNEALSLRKDFERTSLDGSELELGRFSEVIAPSLFSEQRVVVVRDLQDVIGEVGEEILASFEAIDTNTHLIFLHRGGVKGKGLVS